MKYKTTFTLFAVLLASSAALGRIDWVQQSPYPADVDLNAVWFQTPDHGFISGFDDLLMETTDGGVTWAQVSSVARNPQFHEDPIWDIQFVDAQNGFAVGNTIFRTTDGGQTWQDLGSQGSIYGVDFITPDIGYLHGGLFVLRTTNGGDSFTMVWNWETFDPVSDLDFFDADKGLIVGVVDDQAGVFETTNRGDTWNRISNEAFSRVLYVTEDIVIASRYAEFHRSTDGGRTWTLVFEDNNEPVNGVEAIRMVDADSIAAIDINARIWISNDAGLTWTRTFGPMGNVGYGWDIRFADASTGYAVGRLGLVYKSIDGGQSWKQISNGAAAALNDIEMLPTGVGIAVGDTGVILRTSDFGRQWDVLPQQHSGIYAVDLNTVEAVDHDTIVAAGDVFLRSDDAGETWTEGGTLPGEAFDVSFIDEMNGWTFGYLNAPWGYIARTTDGGQTWVRVPEGRTMPTVTEGKMMPSGRGWGLVPQSEQSITDDGFDSLVPRSLPSGDSWQEFDFATDDVGWYGGFFGGVLKSETGGYIFEQQTLPGFRRGSGADTDRLTDVVALSPQEAYISIFKGGAIYDGVIYQTLSGGANWTPLDPIQISTHQFGAAPSEIDVLPTGEIWVMSSAGFIFASDVPVVITPGDTNGDGVVNFADLLEILGAWGPCSGCPADLDGDGFVTFADILIVLANWS